MDITFLQDIALEVGSYLPNLMGALAILIFGWLFASIMAFGVRKLLHQTDLDNRLGQWLLSQEDQEIRLPTEQWIATAVYWTILLFVLIAFLNALNLEVVSRPLNEFLGEIFAYLPRLGGAALLLGVAWILATVAKLILTRGLARFRLDDRLLQPPSESTPAQPTDQGTDQGSEAKGSEASGTATSDSTSQATAATDQAGQQPGAGPFVLNETLGNALYWFILLFFLPLVLDVLNLQGPLEPVQNLLDQILSALPRLLTAGIIAAIGWLIARIVRGIVTNLLAATGANRLGGWIGLQQEVSGSSVSGLLGTVVYVLILIPTAIAALNVLEIQAISDPAISMLEQILRVIPQIFTAGLILLIFFLIGRFVSELVTRLLHGFGFDNVLQWLGLPQVPTPDSGSSSTSASSTSAAAESSDSSSSDPSVEPLTAQLSRRRTPSEFVGLLVLVGILLFGAVAATEVLQFEALTRIVQSVLAVSIQVLSGVVIFAIGLYLANLAYSLISSSGGSQAQILAQTARIAIIALVGAMALQQMGVATDIVNLAFGLLLGAIAVAIALAFGLGGRDIAAEQIRKWLASFQQDQY